MLFNELDVFKRIVKNKQSYFYEGPIYYRKKIKEQQDLNDESIKGTHIYIYTFYPKSYK